MITNKCWKIKIALGFILLGLLCPLAVYIFLIYGNPQWHRQIYLYQLRSLLRKGNVATQMTWRLPTPEGYDGVWLDWYPDGQLAQKDTFKCGKLTGFVKYYGGKERPYCEMTFSDIDRSNYTMRFWDSKGNLVVNGEYRGEKPWNGTFYKTARRFEEAMDTCEQYVDGKVTKSWKIERLPWRTQEIYAIGNPESNADWNRPVW